MSADLRARALVRGSYKCLEALAVRLGVREIQGCLSAGAAHGNALCTTDGTVNAVNTVSAKYAKAKLLGRKDRCLNLCVGWYWSP